MAVIFGAALFLLFGWWFFATYANPRTLEIMFLIASVILAFWGGWRLGRLSREE